VPCWFICSSIFFFISFVEGSAWCVPIIQLYPSGSTILPWRAENPSNKYPAYFAPHPAMLTGNLKEARILLDEAVELLPEDPLIVSLQGVFYALTLSF
jgi:hypothetical protein